MPRRQTVLALEEEGAAELKADAEEFRTADQHAVEGGDGLVEQRVALLLVDARLLRRADRREPDAEDNVGTGPSAPGQRPQDSQRFFELAVSDQRPSLGHAGGAGRRWGRLRGPGDRCGEQEARRDYNRLEYLKVLHRHRSRSLRRKTKENPPAHAHERRGSVEAKAGSPPWRGLPRLSTCYYGLRAPNAPVMLVHGTGIGIELAAYGERCRHAPRCRGRRRERSSRYRKIRRPTFRTRSRSPIVATVTPSKAR